MTCLMSPTNTRISTAGLRAFQRLAVIGWCCIVGFAPTQICGQDLLKCPSFGSDVAMMRGEIGLNLLGWVYFDYDPVYPRPSNPRSSIVNGIIYRRRIGNNAIRAGLEVFRDQFEASRGVYGISGYYSASGSSVRKELRLGYERKITCKRVNPYVAIDLVARLERVQLEGEGIGDVAWGWEIQKYAYDVRTLRLGPSVSIGLSWRFSGRFSFSAEGGAWLRLVGGDNVPYTSNTRIYYDVLRSLSIHYLLR